MPATLTASNIVVGYHSQHVLRGVNIRLSEGDPPLGLIGPSGVGKTTVVDTLLGRLRPSQGKVLFNNHDVTRRRGRGAREFRSLVRGVSQDSLSITDPRETVRTRVQHAQKIARRAGRTHRVSPEELLLSVGLEIDFLPRKTSTLSGGERQRLAFATALATRPSILLLDEPLTAVDPHARREMTTHLSHTISQLGTAVLVASHDLELMAHLCPEVTFLYDGELISRDHLPRMMTSPQHPVIADFATYTPWGS